jgi:hypothetical protein
VSLKINHVVVQVTPVEKAGGRRDVEEREQVRAVEREAPVERRWARGTVEMVGGMRGRAP